MSTGLAPSCAASGPIFVGRVDGTGETVDFTLSVRRDVKAVKAFFMNALKHQGQPPNTITLYGYAASRCAALEMRADG